jgi:hypothetical protein
VMSEKVEQEARAPSMSPGSKIPHPILEYP